MKKGRTIPLPGADDEIIGSQEPNTLIYPKPTRE